MNLLTTVLTTKFDNNQLILKNEYEERIYNWNQTGGNGLYANFCFKLVANYKSEINVFSDEIRVTIDDDGKTFDFILRSLVKKLSTDEVELFGFDIYIMNRKFKEFEGNGEGFFLLRSLEDLIRTSLFEKIVRKPTLLGNRFLMNKLETINRIETEAEDTLSVIMPHKTNNYSVYLSEKYKILNPENESLNNIEYTILPLSIMKPFNIELTFTESPISTNDKVRYYDIVKNITGEVSTKGFNLLGFKILVCLKDREYAEIEENEFQRFAWALRNLLNYPDVLAQIDESTRN